MAPKPIGPSGMAAALVHSATILPSTLDHQRVGQPGHRVMVGLAWIDSCCRASCRHARRCCPPSAALCIGTSFGTSRMSISPWPRPDVRQRPHQDGGLGALRLLHPGIEFDRAIGDGLAGLEAGEAAGGPGAVGVAGIGHLQFAAADRDVAGAPGEGAVPVAAAIVGGAPIGGLITVAEIIGQYDPILIAAGVRRNRANRRNHVRSPTLS